MEIFIDEIVKKTKKKYGETCIFHELELNSMVINKTLVFYRVKTEFNDPTIYQIQFQIFDKVKNSCSQISKYLHKCKYCNKKNVNYKFICCNKYTHLICGVQNNFACCYLKSKLKTAPTKEECCVCLNATECITYCEHRLCVDCLGEIGKKKCEIYCPICRKLLVNNNDVNIFTHVIVNTTSNTYSYV